VADNMVITVVGDFDPDAMRSTFQEQLGKMDGRALEIPFKNIMPPKGIHVAEIKMEREQTVLFFGFLGASLNGPDKHYLDILSSILSGENGKLYREVRGEAGLAYALDTYSVPGFESGYIVSYVATDRRSLTEVDKILRDELRKVASGGIDAENIELAKRDLIGRHAISLQRFSALAFRMTLDELYDIGYDNYLKYSGIISDIKDEEVIKAAIKYIDMDDYASVTVLGSE